MSVVFHHHRVRYVGLAGSLLLAGAAVVGGAFPVAELRATPLSIWQGDGGPATIGLWLVGTALQAYAWWTARHGVPSARWALVTIGLWLLPLLVVPPLGSRDVYAYACQGASYAAGLDPYSQGVSALPCPWLDSISMIWRDTPAPYGPFFVLISGGVVAAADGSLTVAIGLFRLVAVLGVGLTAVALPVLARRCGVPVQRALWLALACPLVGVHLIAGAHNDALMIGLLVAGLALVARRTGRLGAELATGSPNGGAGTGAGADRRDVAAGRRAAVGVPLAAGVLLGLAIAIKVTAAVVVPFAALLVIVGPWSWRALLRDGWPVVAGTIGTVVGVTLVAGLDFGWIGGLSRSGDAIAWTSPPTAVGQTIGYVAVLFGWHVDALPAARAVGLAVLAVLLVLLWWRARTRDPLYGAALALAATVALAPVFHPWYATWPLALLAATAVVRTEWFTIVALVNSFNVLPDGTGLPRFTKLPGAPLMTLLVIVVAVRLVRSARASRADDEPRTPRVDDRTS